MKILLVEDEPKTARYIKRGLEENYYSVETAGNGITGVRLALANTYDLIITDLIMPQMDGRELCKQVRLAGIETPVLMLTALGATDQVILGFEVGADDYLTKPFEFKELLLRIKAILRRSKPRMPSNLLSIGGLEMDVDRRVVHRDGKRITLTVKEFALLEYFLQNAGRVISRSELARNIWKIDFDTGTNMVEVYVNYLRNKIDKGFDSKLIHTQFGMGYFLKAE
ncbi:MAG: response regulator transcription factor [Cyclobacteriaceae bacterium]|nr:response regulator transcription factor [Cyclobacteriaceae bacterium]